jgi:hypothetical protein
MDLQTGASKKLQRAVNCQVILLRPWQILDWSVRRQLFTLGLLLQVSSKIIPASPPIGFFVHARPHFESEAPYGTLSDGPYVSFITHMLFLVSAVQTCHLTPTLMMLEKKASADGLRRSRQRGRS